MKIQASFLLLALPILIASLSFHEQATNICTFNELPTVPGKSDYTFTLKVQKTSHFVANDIGINGWKNVTKLNHPFFKWVGNTAAFQLNFIKMGCQIADAATFGRVCNIPAASINDFKSKAYGQDIIFKCKVPANNVAFAVEFLTKVETIKSEATHWSIFGGLNAFKDATDVKKIVQYYGSNFAAQLKSTNLLTFNVDTELAFWPDINQDGLAELFNKNPTNPLVTGLKANVNHDMTDFAVLKVLPPGTEFIIGSIFKGTTSVKQICENFNSTVQNCGINV